jgi:ABC-2 type transport system permease protein
MRWPEPPSLAWLLRHELRVGGRGLGGIRSRAAAVLALVVLGLFHAGAWFAMRNFDIDGLLARAAPVAIVMSLFAFMLMLGSAFGLAVQALFERGDLDLLMSSPVPVEHVYAARALYVALASTGLVALFLAPFANVGPFHGRWGTLSVYPVLFSLGLACSAIAFLGAFGLVRALGARRARVMSQVLGAVIGAALVLAMQLESFLPAAWRERIAAWSRSGDVREWFSAASPLAWPLRALAGDAWLTPLTIVAATAFFAIVVRASAPRFAAATRQSLAAPPPAARAAAARPFRTGLWRIVLAKELTLVARDPALIARTLLQLLYLLPLFLVLLRKSQPPALAAAALVMLAMSLAGTLAWLTMSGEEAPELLASAPVNADHLRWLKVLAALLPVLALCVPFVSWFAMQSAWDAAVVVGCLLPGLVSAALMQVWTARPGTRRDLRARYKQNVFVNFAEQFTASGWAALCYLALTGAGGYAWLAVPLAVVAPAAVWFRRRPAFPR